MNYKIHTGLCQDVLAQMEENSIDAIVTDPPYGLSFMGKKWDYEVPNVEIWQACLRVLKPGGYLLAFAGTRTQHRMAVNIEDAGFEIRDMIAWVYGSGFPKSHNIGKAVDKLQGNEREVVGEYVYPDGKPRNTAQHKTKRNGIYSDIKTDDSPNDRTLTKGNSEWEGWGTALKPALEPITVARKPFKCTVAENVLEHGTGGLNIDGCRINTNEETSRPQSAFCHSGEKTGIVTGGHGGLGRFPANLIHDGSDEVVGLFPETGGGKFTIGGTPRKTEGHVCTGSPDRTDAIMNYGDSGSAARFFYCAKASKADRNEGLPEGTVSKHPTVKPTDLMRYLCRLVTPPNGTVLDPFAGSGSTGKGAILEGFTPILIEADEQWKDIIKARCEFALKQYYKENAQKTLF